MKSIMFLLVLLFCLVAPERSAPIGAAPVDLVVEVPVDLVVEADVLEHLQLEFGVKKTKSKHAKSKKEQTKKKPAFKSKGKSKSKHHTSTFSRANSTSHLTGPPRYR